MIAPLLLAGLLALEPRESHPAVLHAAITAHVVAQFADVSTTQYLLGTGRFKEANPAMRWAAGGPVRMAIVKGAYAVGTSYLFLRIHRRYPKTAFVAAVISAGFTAYVVHRNSNLVQQAR